MADWRNRMEQILNKFKFQLNAKGVDNIQQLKEIFMVSGSLLSAAWVSAPGRPAGAPRPHL